MNNVTSLVANFNVSYGYKTLFALKSDGSVWYWGSKIGDPEQMIQKRLLDDVISIKSMGSNVYVVKTDGSVWSWNAASYLPYNLSKNEGPEKIEGLAGIVNIQPDIYTNYAYKQDGTVWIWPRTDPGSIPIQLHTAIDTQSIIQFHWKQDPNIDSMYAFRGDGQLWSLENDNVLPGLDEIVSVHQRGSYAASKYHYVLKKITRCGLGLILLLFCRSLLFSRKTRQLVSALGHLTNQQMMALRQKPNLRYRLRRKSAFIHSSQCLSLARNSSLLQTICRGQK